MLLLILTLLFNYNIQSNNTISNKFYIKIDSIIINVKINKTIDVLKHYEKYESTPYYSNNYWYIGYGHMILKGEHFTTLTEKQADSLFKVDFEKHKKQITKYLNKDTKIEYVYLCTMLAFNIGVYKVKNYDIVKYINENKDVEIIKDKYIQYCINEGNLHKGLLERRKQELNIWL